MTEPRTPVCCPSTTAFAAGAVLCAALVVVASISRRELVALRAMRHTALPRARTPLVNAVTEIRARVTYEEMVFVHAQRRIAGVAGVDRRIAQPEQRARHKDRELASADATRNVGISLVVRGAKPQPAASVWLGNGSLSRDRARLFNGQHRAANVSEPWPFARAHA